MNPVYNNSQAQAFHSTTLTPIGKIDALKRVIKGDIQVALNLLEKAERRVANSLPSQASNHNDFENLYYLQYITGMMYLEGTGAEVDLKRAAFHFSEAVALCNKIKPQNNQAKSDLYLFCMEAELSTSDVDHIQEIITFLEQHYKNISQLAIWHPERMLEASVLFRIGTLHELSGNSIKARDRCLLAIKSGHLGARIWMAKSKTLSIEKRLEHLYMAAKGGHPDGITQLEELIQSPPLAEMHSNALIVYQAKLAELYFDHNNIEKAFLHFKQIADKYSGSQHHDINDITSALARCVLNPEMAGKLDQSEVMGYLKAAADLNPPDSEAAFKYAVLSINNDEPTFLKEMGQHIRYGDLPYLQSDSGALKYLKIAASSRSIIPERFKQLLFPIVDKNISHEITNYYARHLFLMCLVDKTDVNYPCRFQKEAFTSLEKAYFLEKTCQKKSEPGKSRLVENGFFPINNFGIEKSYLNLLPIKLNAYLYNLPQLNNKCRLPDGFVQAFHHYAILDSYVTINYCNDLRKNVVDAFREILSKLNPQLSFILGSQIKEEYPKEAVRFFTVAAEAKIPGAVKALLDLDLIVTSQMANQTAKKDSSTSISEEKKEALLKVAATLPNANADEIFEYAEILFKQDMKKADSFWGIKKFESETFYKMPAFENHDLAHFRLLEIDVNVNKNKAKANQTKLGNAYLTGFYTPSQGALPVNVGRNKDKAIKYLGQAEYDRITEEALQTNPAPSSEKSYLKKVTRSPEAVKEIPQEKEAVVKPSITPTDSSVVFQVPEEKSTWSKISSAIDNAIFARPVVRDDPRNNLDNDTSVIKPVPVVPAPPTEIKENSVSLWLGELFNSKPPAKGIERDNDL